MFLAVVNRKAVHEQPSVPVKGTDLAEVIIDEKDGHYHMLTNSDLVKARLSDDEVLEMAEAGTEKMHFTARTLTETLGLDLQAQGYDKDFADDATATYDAANDVFVLTNDKSFLGASVLTRTDVLRDLHSRIGDYFIIPSSIHEVLAVSKEMGADVKDLETMLRSVNATEVKESERLSDQIFYFDGKELSMARNAAKEEIPNLTKTDGGEVMSL